MQPGSFGGPKLFVVKIYLSHDVDFIDFAVIALSDDALRLISDRNRAFHMVQAVDEDLSELTFYADECTFYVGDLEKLLSKRQREKLEEVGWVELEPGQNLPPMDEEKTDVERVHVRENDVQWTACVKHTDAYVETRDLSLKVIFGKESD